jgi:hypothetical protein
MRLMVVPHVDPIGTPYLGSFFGLKALMNRQKRIYKPIEARIVGFKIWEGQMTQRMPTGSIHLQRCIENYLAPAQ